MFLRLLQPPYVRLLVLEAGMLLPGSVAVSRTGVAGGAAHGWKHVDSHAYAIDHA
jgi:hypothetical protein